MGRRSFFVGAGFGAGLMYLLDPAHGAARRRRLAERSRDLLTEVEGTLSEGDEAFEADAPSTAAQATGRSVVSVPAEDAASARLAEPSRNGSPLRRADDIPGLELPGQRRSRGAGGTLARLTERAGMLGVVGGALAAYGLTRRGRTGRLLRVVGLGLLARGLREAERGERPLGERRRAIDVQQSFEVAAPLPRVFAFWRSGDNFARFLAHVRETRDLGGGRTRWRAETPDGAPVEWTTTVVEYVPDHLIAWRSEPGAAVRQSGIVRLAPAAGGTRIDLRLCYGPPEREGGIESELFGPEPRRQIAEDLARLRDLLEAAAPAARQGDTARGARTPGTEETEDEEQGP